MIPYIAVISSGRPGRVQFMKEHLARLSDIAVWYVGEDQKPDYAYAGATNVIESGGLCESRNAALEDAFRLGRACVQLSDDLTGVDWCVDRENKHRITLERAIAIMFQHAAAGTPLVGAAATDNAFFMPKDDVSEHAFIIGDFILVHPNPLRFDTGLRLKEDLDYSIQHLKTFGKVARLNTLLAGWQHRTNYGGAVQYRTRETEREAIAFIQAKHPGWTRLNPRRENELLLVYPPAEIETVSPLRVEA